MLFVWKRRRRVLHGVREVSDFGVCPLFFLRNKLFRGRSKALERGIEVHREAFEAHAREAVEMPPEVAYELSFEEKVIGREVWVDNGVVGGFADLVVMEDGAVRVVELKSTAKSAEWVGSRLQALAYGVLFRGISSDVVVEVRTFGGSLFWRKKIGSRDERTLEKIVEELEDHVLRGFFPPKVGSHCRNCPFRKTCPVFKDAEEMLMGVVEVKGDGRVHL